MIRKYWVACNSVLQSGFKFRWWMALMHSNCATINDQLAADPAWTEVSGAEWLLQLADRHNPDFNRVHETFYLRRTECRGDRVA